MLEPLLGEEQEMVRLPLKVSMVWVRSAGCQENKHMILESFCFEKTHTTPATESRALATCALQIRAHVFRGTIGSVCLGARVRSAIKLFNAVVPELRIGGTGTPKAGYVRKRSQSWLQCSKDIEIRGSREERL